MSEFKSVDAWTKNVEKATKRANYRAMNKAAAKAKSSFQRALAKQSGLKSRGIAARLFVRKATASRPAAAVSFGVKIGVPLSEFKPKAKMVKGPGRRRYTGVTVAIPFAGGRQVVPGGWLATVRSGKALVLKRKGRAKYPTVGLRYDMRPLADAERTEENYKFREEFQKIYPEQLKYELGK